MQWLRAMPPCADADTGAIKQRGKIMRMGVIQRKGKNPAAILRAGGPTRRLDRAPALGAVEVTGGGDGTVPAAADAEAAAAGGTAQE